MDGGEADEGKQDQKPGKSTFLPPTPTAASGFKRRPRRRTGKKEKKGLSKGDQADREVGKEGRRNAFFTNQPSSSNELSKKG
jgi:hypothetical protein